MAFIETSPVTLQDKSCYAMMFFGVALASLDLATNPGEIASLIENGCQYARNYTLDAWREHITKMYERTWQMKL